MFGWKPYDPPLTGETGSRLACGIAKPDAAHVGITFDETARRSVVLVERDEHVVAVIAAVQENANEGFVIACRRRRQRLDHAKRVDTRGQRHAAERAGGCA